MMTGPLLQVKLGPASSHSPLRASAHYPPGRRWERRHLPSSGQGQKRTEPFYPNPETLALAPTFLP